MNIIEFLSQPWPWWVAGPMIAVVLWAMLGLGKRFGVSNTHRITCSALGAGRFIDYFRWDWKSQSWNMVFILGAVIGGVLASTVLANPDPIALSAATVADLRGLGIAEPGARFVPSEVFSLQALTTPTGWIMPVLGGFLVGFGSRYADGCTSGHAISGMANLQWPSLVTVIGFFIGGLFATFFLLPLIMNS